MSPPPKATRRLLPITFHAEEMVAAPFDDMEETRFRLIVRSGNVERAITDNLYDNVTDAVNLLADLLAGILRCVEYDDMQGAITAGVTAASRDLNHSIENIKTSARYADNQLDRRLDGLFRSMGDHLRLHADVDYVSREVLESALANMRSEEIGPRATYEYVNERFALIDRGFGVVRDHMNQRKHTPENINLPITNGKSNP